MGGVEGPEQGDADPKGESLRRRCGQRAAVQGRFTFAGGLEWTARTQSQHVLDGAAAREAAVALDRYRSVEGYAHHDGPWTCSHCGTAAVFDRRYSAEGKLKCPCEVALYDAAWRAFVAENRAKWVQDLHHGAGFPARLAGRTFDGFTKRQGATDALKKCHAYADRFTTATDVGLWLIGAFGAGKTHLAIATARALIERLLLTVRFVSAAELIASVRGDGDGAKWDWGAVDRAISAELLILDDVGQEQPTPFSRDVLYRVIAGRYEAQRPTIITSNGADAQPEERLGGAAVSRLYEMSERIVLKATDYRQEILRARQAQSKEAA